jgi:uncharacterized protein (DUF2267 family)
MSSERFNLFQETLETSTAWVRRIGDLAGIDEQQAYHMLCCTLQTLRDRLRPEEAIELGGRLPPLIRGLYYDGWRLAGVPLQIRNKQHFVALAVSRYHARPLVDIEPGIRAVLAVLTDNVDLGAVCDVVLALPAELRDLWPEHVVRAAATEQQRSAGRAAGDAGQPRTRA